MSRVAASAPADREDGDDNDMIGERIKLRTQRHFCDNAL